MNSKMQVVANEEKIKIESNMEVYKKFKEVYGEHSVYIFLSMFGQTGPVIYNKGIEMEISKAI